MEKKDQLANVAFGGNWSEEILRLEELNGVLKVIDEAVEACTERDVVDQALLDALGYIKDQVEKGPGLAESFLKGVRIPNQGLRKRSVQKTARMMRTWAGKG